MNDPTPRKPLGKLSLKRGEENAAAAPAPKVEERLHQVLAQAALQAQPGHAEGAVLVVHPRIDGVVAGFRDPPRHAALAAVFNLARHRRLAGLVEQRVVVARHDQHRHQVLEHRAAPREQCRFAAGRRQ